MLVFMAQTITTIISNGSKWRGEAPDPIETLFERLAEHTLDPRWCKYGDGGFAQNLGDGMIKIWGNFWHISAVFDIDTNDGELIARLFTAIRANCATEEFRAAARSLGIPADKLPRVEDRHD